VVFVAASEVVCTELVVAVGVDLVMIVGVAMVRVDKLGKALF